MLAQSAVTWGPRQNVLSVAGAEATAWIDEEWRLWRAGRDGTPSPVPVPPDLALPALDVPPEAGPFAAHELPAFVRQAEAFADAIEGRPRTDPAPATFADGVAVQRIMDAARQASRTRRWIRL